MEKPQISWRPQKLVLDQSLVEAMLFYAGERSNFRLYENGTVLLLNPDRDTEENVIRCLEELAFIPDFRVVPMKNGNYMVSPHSVGAVLILEEEITRQIADLEIHRSKALYPGEVFFQADQNLPIGLIGRAKLYKDALEKKQIYHHSLPPARANESGA